MRKRFRRTIQEMLRPDEAAHELFAVFMQRQKATRSLPKDFLLSQLAERSVYAEFLKLCLEYDRSNDLSGFRKGLALIVKAIGPGKVAKLTGINRVTLYRMLGRGGNPGIKNLVMLLKALNLGVWVVEQEFYDHRERVRRRSGRSSHF